MSKMSSERCFLTREPIRDGDAVVVVEVGRAEVCGDETVDRVGGKRFGIALLRPFLEQQGVPQFKIEEVEKSYVG
jgi:hypothetical protein